MQAQPRLAVLASLWRTIRYHVGSVVFGSLLIATIQFARAVLHYLQRQVEKETSSRVVKALFRCVGCCLKCFQTIVEIVTRNTYIFVRPCCSLLTLSDECCAEGFCFTALFFSVFGRRCVGGAQGSELLLGWQDGVPGALVARLLADLQALRLSCSMSVWCLVSPPCSSLF